MLKNKFMLSALTTILLMGCEAGETQKQENNHDINPVQNSSQSNTVETQSTQSVKSVGGQQQSIQPKPQSTPVPEYPFVGQKNFNFMGGSGTEMSIKVSQDGNVKIWGCGITACSTYYKGKFKPIMPIGDGQYVKITKGKAYLLNAAMKVEVDCMGDGKPCVSQLY